jgi:hypothetical protein
VVAGRLEGSYARGGGVARGGDVGVWPLDTVAVASCEKRTAGRGVGAERKAGRATAGEAIERMFYVPSLFSFSFFLGVEIVPFKVLGASLPPQIRSMDEPRLQPRGRKRPRSGDSNVSNDATSTLGMILVCVFLFVRPYRFLVCDFKSFRCFRCTYARTGAPARMIDSQS